MRVRAAFACVWVACLALACVLHAPAAQAQSESELKAARKLFADAIHDQDESHFDVALEKFRRVQSVKDTQPVRYRIASCLESLGKLRDAARAYEATLDENVAGQDADVTRAAHERSEAVSKRLARVTLTISVHAPADAAVRVDDEAVPANALGAPIPLDPGQHEVVGTAKDAPAFRTTLTLSEGGQASILVMLDPPAPVEAPKPQVEATVERSPKKTWGYVAVIGGGVLAAGGVVTLLLRHGDIADLNKACASGICPADRRDELTSTRSRALAEGPIAWTLVGAGVVAAGIGAYLLATPDRHAAFAPIVTRDGASFTYVRTF